MVEGEGSDAITIGEGRNFIAGMVNTLLHLNDLKRLKDCM